MTDEFLGHESHWPEGGVAERVERWLADLAETEEARRAALDGLWRLGPEDGEAVGPLGATLESGDGEARVFAARFLSLLGEGAGMAVPTLCRALDDADTDVREWSADALGRIGSRASVAIPRLEQMTQETDSWVRVLAQGALLKLDTRPQLIHALAGTKGSDDIALQCWGLSLVIDVADRYDEALPALLAYLGHHYDPHIEDIGRCLARKTEAIQPLVQALTTGEDWARRNAARVLGHQAAHTEVLIAALAEALSDPFPDVRWSAAGALSQLHSAGIDVRTATPALRGAAGDEESVDTRLTSQRLLDALVGPEGPSGPKASA